MGSITAPQEVYEVETIDGETTDPLGAYRDLETLIRGLFNKDTFLNFIRYFCILKTTKPLLKVLVISFYAVQKH